MRHSQIIWDTDVMVNTVATLECLQELSVELLALFRSIHSRKSRYKNAPISAAKPPNRCANCGER